MRDLLKLSEEELAELSARQALRVWIAAGLAIGSAVLALLGMMARYSPNESPPLPGMNHLWGQVGWAATLGLSMVVAAWLVRGVIMRRLQWAVAISLLLHLLLGVSLQTLRFGVPLSQAAEADEAAGASREELTLPNYGGMEAPNAEAEAAWQKPAEANTPETQMELDRQKSELQQPNQPEALDVERQTEVAKLEEMKRQEQAAFQKEAKTELERQQREQELPTPQAVAAPKVETMKTAQPELDTRVEQAKKASELAKAEHEQAELNSTDPSVAAARMKANRADPKTKMSEQQIEFNERQALAAKTAPATANESVKVATAEAKQASAQERAVEAARQAQANVPASQRPTSNVPSQANSATIGSVRTERATNATNPGDATPTSGGSAQLARSNNGQLGGAANATAQSVNVASAAGVGAPKVSESSGASAATRGSAATVPLGNAGQGTGNALSTPQSGAPSKGSTGNLARQSTGTGQPQLGQAEASKLGSGGTGRQANAVGTQAGEVNVASAAGSSSAKSGVLGNGPANTSVGRQATGVPARETNGTSDSTGPASTASTSSAPTAVRSSTGGGLAAKTSEPSAQLDANAGFAKGSNTGLSTTRAAAAPVSTGASAAEQSGSLVFSGPQAQPSSGGKLAGPQSTASVPRRSAGLPGSSGGPTAVGTPNGSSPTQPTRIAGGSARPGVGDDGPKLATEAQVAGLIKRAAPGIGASPEAKIAAGFSMRKAESRREAIKSLGGSEESEKAVERGLLWLAKHQDADGHWGIHELHCKDHECTGHGSFQSNTAATGLGLLAFLGAGYTHQSGEHQAVVDRGLKWLVQHQKPDGDLFADESEFVWFYSHGMAAIALCEAYGLTKDPALREPAQKALNFIVASQHPQFGGWRYRPKFESDTSVSGWQLMALKSGEMAGLSVPKEVYSGVAKWLDSVESKTAKGQFSYHPSRPASLAMSAEGLLMRQYLGAVRTDARLVAGADSLRQRLPDLADRDSYYWYYATQVMFHMQGPHWDEWNTRLRDTLISTQLKDGDPNGSWSPDRPTPEKWGAAGGRHYITCLNLLMLEVYYRHLPLYIELGK
ncbi:MAG: hypothetical protein ACKV2Q_36285 [Planctomycetaceae bacterium]